MASDMASLVYGALSLPGPQRVSELTRLLDQACPFKELAGVFPHLVDAIFGGACSSGWGLRAVTPQTDIYEFEALHRFLAPDGPFFRLCYKLLADSQLKYSFPIAMLPLDIQQMLERGRYPQYYGDLISIDAQTIHLVSLALNPFDYYMFHFATHLLNTNVNKFTWEDWNTVYFALACDYLTHFMPIDPSTVVLPHIPYYTGKAPVVAPLHTSNRQLQSQSLLLIQDLPGVNSQHSSGTSQTQPRNEIWRTETVMQVFIDVWLSVDEYSQSPMETHSFVSKQCPLPTTTGERVRVTRMLVKHVHAFASKFCSDPIPRSSSLRKCAQQALCTRAYHYITYLVKTWPLDASFRLVLELWLSTIQPWRYTGDDPTIHDRSPARFSIQHHQEERLSRSVDPSYTQFIAENLPAYTTIFQLIIPRFTRLDLTAPKNAIMLYRLGKVFAQPNLAMLVRDIEMAAMGQNAGLNLSGSVSNWSMSSYGYSMSEQSPSNKWGAIAKQAIAELNAPPAPCYQPMWSEQSRELAYELTQKMANSKVLAEKLVGDIERRLRQQNQGFWSFLNFWSMGNADEDDFHLEDRRKVPSYLGTAIQQFAQIFGFNESSLVDERTVEENHSEHSSFTNPSQFPLSIAPQSRNKSTNIQYMGDPEMIPISSYESTILVRILYQISSRINEAYQQEMSELWRRQDIWGCISREVLQRPRTIHTYIKGGPTYSNLVTETLGPRISLRRFASYAFIVWLSIGCIIFRMFGFGCFTYFVFLTVVWMAFILFKASLKQLGLLKQNDLNIVLQ